MGNTGSKKGDVLATAAVSKYMNFHREQLLDIRNTCLTLMDKKRNISRVNFHSAVLRARIKDAKVNDILDHLFTMWDLTGEDKVPCMEFILGLSMLACRAESFKSVLRFALQVHDVKCKGKIKAEQLVVVLKSMNTTASYFGDSVLALWQVYKVVDNAFDTLTSDDNEEAMHKDVVDLLAQEPLIDLFLKKKLKKSHRVTFAPFHETLVMHSSYQSEDLSNDGSIRLTPVITIPVPLVQAESLLGPMETY